MTSFTERRQRTTDTAGTLVLLELTAPSFAETLRLVDDTQNWTINGLEYIGFPFGFKGPDDVSGQVPRAQLVIDNVGRAFTQDLESRQPDELITAKVMITDRADPTTIERTLYLPMTQVSVNSRQVSAQCGMDFLTRQQAVLLRANPFTLPGIF
ncbi:DUF1833 family protein [[Pseudomonas] boreopolis]|uniref:DUF1833 domain-containing protein n=1 Tax=Xanthomonas boreopolis TaxID=86183 RepID=A0A919F7K5_9XANT|nr:hypothetical protein GCM10009090_16650 [[Pseudomonas] boreopolis]